MTASAVIDTDLFSTSPGDIMSAGINNLAEDSQECTYAVRRGSKPVRNFPPTKVSGDITAVNERDFFERSFPFLFP